MIQFGASTEEVLERWELARERSRGRRLYGVLDLDSDSRTLI